MKLDKSEFYAYENVFRDDKYKLIVLDMDGTLYYQRKMQLLMCKEMAFFALLHPFSLWKLKTISVFRKVREAQPMAAGNESAAGKPVAQRGESLLQKHFADTAQRIGKTPEQVQKVIEEWLFLRPLKYMQICRDAFLCQRVEQWQEAGVKVVVYSDYPAKDKCDALKIVPDGIYSSEQERIGEMKPSPKAIEVIAADFSVSVKEMLVVGDRYSRDGKMAECAGVDYLILEKWSRKRKKKWK